jgi:RNA polymerase sigma-70 factor (ECF subfamily)
MSDTEQIYERMLVLQCRAGDEAAFAKLIATYQPRLRYYLRQILKEPDSADDILQDVWLDVFRALPRLQNIAAFPAWIYEIARCRALRAGRKPSIAQQPLNSDVVIDEQIDETNLTAENAEYIHAALQRIAADHREVLVLRFLEQMSYEEIAKVTGCPPGTVASRIHHAKRALRVELERTTDRGRESFLRR